MCCHHIVDWHTKSSDLTLKEEEKRFEVVACSPTKFH